MANIAVINPSTEEIVSVMTISSGELVKDRSTSNGFLFVHIPANIFSSDFKITNCFSTVSDKFINRGYPPDERFSKWVNSKWEIDLQLAKDVLYGELKNKLYQFITITSNFPEWKQANYTDTASELGFKELASSITAAEQQKLANIRSIRVWKNQLLAERDRVKSSVFKSSQVQQVKSAIKSMNYTPPPFKL